MISALPIVTVSVLALAALAQQAQFDFPARNQHNDRQSEVFGPVHEAGSGYEKADGAWPDYYGTLTDDEDAFPTPGGHQADGWGQEVIDTGSGSHDVWDGARSQWPTDDTEHNPWGTSRGGGQDRYDPWGTQDSWDAMEQGSGVAPAGTPPPILDPSVSRTFTTGPQGTVLDADPIPALSPSTRPTPPTTTTRATTQSPNDFYIENATPPPVTRRPTTQTTPAPVTTNTPPALALPPDAPRATLGVFLQPGILAAVIGGAVIGLLSAVVLVVFIIYRMRKKDEGSYALDETGPSGALLGQSAAQYPYAYNKSTAPREFFA